MSAAPSPASRPMGRSSSARRLAPRLRHRTHGQGTTALRSARPGQLPDAGCDDGPEPGARQIATDQVAVEGARQTAAQAPRVWSACAARFAEARFPTRALAPWFRAALARDILLQRCAAGAAAHAVDRCDRRRQPVQRRWRSAAAAAPGTGADCQDVRLRISFLDRDKALLERLLLDAESLYTNGPAGGGGVRRHIGESLGTASFLIDAPRCGNGWSGSDDRCTAVRLRPRPCR